MPTVMLRPDNSEMLAVFAINFAKSGSFASPCCALPYASQLAYRVTTSHSPAHKPVWKRDTRRNSAPCFSKIIFAFLAFLTISSVLSLLKRVICVIAAMPILLGFALVCGLDKGACRIADLLGERSPQC